MAKYIDAFVLPIQWDHLNEYRRVSETVAQIWKEHGAIDYFEYVIEDPKLEGTLSFPQLVARSVEEAIIFGWVSFDSKETRNLANERVASDPRMEELIGPLMDPSRIIFDAKRMVFGGFQSFVNTSN